MKLAIPSGATSRKIKIFVRDSSKTDGSGLTGLTNATSGLKWYYIKDGDSSPTSVSITSATLGTFTSGGFIVADGTNMPGVYEIGIPNAALSGGTCHMMLSGAANMVPAPIEIQTDNVPADAKAINAVATTSVTAINANQGTTQPVNFSGTGSSAFVKADAEQLNAQSITAAAGVTFPAALASPTNITAGTITTVTNLTNAPTNGDFNSTMKANFPSNFSSMVIDGTGRVNAFLIGILTSVFTEGATGRISAAFKQFFNVTTPTSTMNEITLVDTLTANGDKAGYALTSAYDPAKTASQAGNQMDLVNAPNATAITAIQNGLATSSSQTSILNRLPTSLTANGNMKVAIEEFISTVLTESSAGQIEAAFKKMFDVASPVFTSASVNQTGDSYGRIGVAGVGLTNLGDTRIANLDTTVSSRLATSGYTAPDNTNIGVAATQASATYNIVNSGTYGNSALLAAVQGVLTTQLTESYATNGSVPTLSQAVMLIQQALTDFSITGTTTTIRKVNHSTAAATLTLNDGTSPTAVTRAS